MNELSTDGIAVDDSGEDDEDEDPDEEPGADPDEEPGADPDDSFLLWPPYVEGELYIDISNDWTIDSDNPAAEMNEVSTSVDLGVNVFLAESAFVSFALSRSTFTEPAPGRDRYFGGESLSVDTLSVNWEAERWSFIGGKFIPNFSIAYYAAPGLYGTDIAESDIELSDRIGFGGSATFISDERFGTHALSASVFFRDTSILSDLLQTGDRPRRRDGGPGNTGSLKSFAVALDGAGIAALPGFRYHIGFVRQAVDRIAVDDSGEDDVDEEPGDDEDTDVDEDEDEDEDDGDPDDGDPDDGDPDDGDPDDGDPNGGDPNGGDPNGGDPDDGDPDDGDPDDGDPDDGDPDDGDPDDGDPDDGDPDDGDPNGADPNGADPNGADPDDGDPDDEDPEAVSAGVNNVLDAGNAITGEVFNGLNGILNAANAIDDEDDNFLPSGEIGDEYRFVIAGQWTVHVNDDLTVTPLVEYVHFWNAGGILNESRDYLTVGTLLEYENWSAAASYSGRFVKEPGGSRTNTTLFQVSAGYTFDFGLGVGIGYSLFKEDDVTSHTAGVLLYYDYSFAL